MVEVNVLMAGKLAYHGAADMSDNVSAAPGKSISGRWGDESQMRVLGGYIHPPVQRRGVRRAPVAKRGNQLSTQANEGAVDFMIIVDSLTTIGVGKAALDRVVGILLGKVAHVKE